MLASYNPLSPSFGDGKHILSILPPHQGWSATVIQRIEFCYIANTLPPSVKEASLAKNFCGLVHVNNSVNDKLLASRVSFFALIHMVIKHLCSNLFSIFLSGVLLALCYNYHKALIKIKTKISFSTVCVTILCNIQLCPFILHHCNSCAFEFIKML